MIGGRCAPRAPDREPRSDAALVKRLLLFVALAASGIAVVVLLSEDPGESVVVSLETGMDRGAGGVTKLVDERGGETEFAMEDVTFPVYEEVEVEPGVLEQRLSRRVTMDSGRPDGEGGFVAEGLVLAMLDLETGEEVGTVRAGEGLFHLDSGVGAATNIRLGGALTDHFTLRGGVEGSFPLDDGRIAEVSALNLEVDGDKVSSPDAVSWRSEGISISGVGMRWDGEVGRLDYERDAHIVVDDAESVRVYDWYGPNGLTFHMPMGEQASATEGWGELRGPLTGVLSDGARVGGETLEVDGRAGTFRIEGSAVYERHADDATTRVTARAIHGADDGAGALALVEANGDVHVVHAPLAMMPSSLLAETVVLQDGLLSSPARASLERGALHTEGEVLAYDTDSGTLEYERDAELSVDEGAGRLAGLHVVAPGGMTWLLPPDATGGVDTASGELRGSVRGSLPDGSRFASELVLFDGPSGRFTLDGASSVTVLREDGPTEVRARRITLHGDELDRIAVVTARGEVVVVSRAIDVLPVRLASDELRWEEGLLTSPGVVTWTREDGTTAIGTAMVWDEEASRLTYERDAHIVLVQPDGATLDLTSDGPLEWRFPADTLVSTGVGHMSEHVRGRSSDGSTLATDHLTYDGRTGEIALRGHAEIVTVDEVDGATRVRGELIRVSGERGERTIDAPGLVRWSRPDMQGEGVDLTWDERSGRLRFEGQAHVLSFDHRGAVDLDARGQGMSWDEPRGHLRFERHAYLRAGPAERPELLISSAGALDWTVPEDVGDPWLHGTGSVHDQVYGVLEDGSRLGGDLLIHDGPSRLTRLIGNATLDRAGADGVRQLAGDEIWMTRGPDGHLAGLQAHGHVEGSAGVYRFTSDHLDYDVAADRLTLTGNCRLRLGGSWMSAHEMNVWPGLEEFEILQSSVVIEPNR